MPNIDKVQIMATVSLQSSYRRRELCSVVRASVEEAEPGVSETDQRLHHERHRFHICPGTHVVRAVMDVHLGCVNLERKLTHLVDQACRYEVI